MFHVPFWETNKKREEKKERRRLKNNLKMIGQHLCLSHSTLSGTDFPKGLVHSKQRFQPFLLLTLMLFEALVTFSQRTLDKKKTRKPQNKKHKYCDVTPRF